MRTALRTIILAIRGWLPSELFRHSEVGVWYDPSDLTTLFADSAGTTAAVLEGPVGLMLDKSKGLVLGAELVTNGGFDSGTTGWTVGAEWSIASGQVSINSVPSYTNLDCSPIVITPGKTYLVTITTISNSGGNVRIALGGGAWASIPSTIGQFTARILAGATANLCRLQTNGGAFTAVLDNISVRELPGNHASQATASSRPTLSQRVNLLTKTEVFSDAAWTKGSATVSANSTTAPDGTLTADTLIAANATALTYVSPNVFTSVAAQYTLSIRVKPLFGVRYVQLAWDTSVSANYANFDLQSAAVSGGSYSSASITSLSDGWFAISITSTLIAAATADLFFILVPSGSSSRAANFVGTGVESVYIWGASLVPADQASLPYQRVDTATSYDTSSVFPKYLKFDGLDDSMSTASIDFTATDKMTVVAGVRKLSDATAQDLVSTSLNWFTSNGAFLLGAPGDAGTARYSAGLRGTTSSFGGVETFAAPISNVVTEQLNIGGALLGDEIKLRVNGIGQTLVNTSAPTTAGTGNFGNYPLFIGRRAGTTLPFNGHLYSLIIRASQSTDAQIVAAETWMNSKTGAY